jgi:hypothetical protein
MVAANPCPLGALAAALRRAQRHGVALDHKGEARKPSDRTTLFDWHSFEHRSNSTLSIAYGVSCRVRVKSYP